MARPKSAAAVLTWFLLTVAVFALLMVTDLSYMYFSNQRDQLKILARNDLMAIMNLKVGQIENWLQERRNDADIIHDNSIFFDPLFAWLAGERTAAREKEIKNWMASLCGDTVYSGISLLDKSGRTLIYFLKRNEGGLEYEPDKIAEAQSSHRTSFGDIHLDSRGRAIMDIYIPISKGRQSGLLVLRINPDLYLYPLIQTWPVPSQSAETLLVRTEGEKVVFLNDLRHKKGTALKLRFPLAEKDLPAALVSLGVRDLIEGKDYRGVHVLAVGRPIPGTSWYLVAKVDESEIYLPMFWIGVRASAIGTLVIILISIWIYLIISRQATQALKESRDAFERLVSASPDAVINTDLNGLITYASEEALKLTGAAARSGLTGKNTFDLITPRDRGLALANFRETLASGLQKNLEYTFLRQDGSQFLGELNAAVTRTAGGKPQGVIITIRDVTEQKAMERVINDSAFKFQALFDNMSSGVVIYLHRQDGGNEFIISDLNRAALRIEKIAKEAVIGRGLLEVFPGVKEMGMFDALLRVWQTGQPEHFPMAFYKDQRISGWRENYLYKLPTGEVVAVYDDVTERKEAAEAIQVSETRYRRLFEAAKDGIIILDADTGLIIDANPYLVELLGFSLEEFHGKKIWEIGFLKDVIKNKDNFLELQQKGFIRYEDLPLQTANGQLINVEFVSNVYRVDHHRVIQCNIRNISERKLVEAKLALQNYHLQRSQELALVGSWDLDMSNKTLTWTDETYRIFGIPGGSTLTYEKFLGLIHPDDRERVAKEWEAAVAGKPFDVEHRIIAHGQVKWVREKAELQYLEKGKPMHAVGAVMDITEYKRLVGLRDEFVNTVSHELRTPMAIIHEGVAQVLEGIHGPVNEGQAHFLSTTLRSIDRLGRIINDLLDISRLESGRMEAKKEPIDFGQVAREVAAVFRPRIEKKKLEFLEQIPAVPVTLCADRDEMTEVLTNLLENALKFTEHGRIGLSITENAETVECAVSDTGRGIAAKDQQRLFEKFTQFGRVAGAGEKGTGLGLAIIKALIELHNGTIRVESEENAGSRFIVTLPKPG